MEESFTSRTALVSISEEQQLVQAGEDLLKWKVMLEKAEEEKSRLLLEKLDAEDEKKKAQEAMHLCLQEQEQLEGKYSKMLKDMQEQTEGLQKENKDLTVKLEVFQEKMRTKTEETASLKQRFKIKAEIPEKRVKFTGPEDHGDSSEETTGIFTITQRPSFLLQGGEALITFEEEKVADQILRLAKCQVTCDKNKMSVKPLCLTLEPSVKFEVHLSVSKRMVQFWNAPPVLPEERMKDRLEMSFSRPSRGGGEVEKVWYDKNAGSGRILFLSSGVAENLVLKRKFGVDANREMMVDVAPLYQYKLRKFQTYCGAPRRTVLLRGVEDVMEEEDLQDHLEIHFQKPSNYGGEVESIRYVSTGKELLAFFSEDTAEA
ncbi:N-myc-interactor-like isoform X2 [Denticeps clupeoides]|nr:N-myc-interactor-like isoform X2 [Denticeps clupeoides]XP_028824729.1 N-myc-interactor-like isoform X2 [Denticeps clupeoides]